MPAPEPPEDLPDAVVSALEDCSDSQLRAVIHYAQRLLREHPELTYAIESRPKEELVRIEEHDAYNIVIVERPEETGEDRGPFAYRVKWEPSIDDESDGKYRWHYPGKVHEE